MIILTRLGNGLPIAVNPDLIERAEPTPDTVVTLVDGHKLVVQETVDVIVDMIRDWRASIAASAITLAHVGQDQETAAGRLEARTSLPGGHDASSAAVLAEEAAHGSPLGRVLRLPFREV